MLEKLKGIEIRYKELGGLIADPDIISNQSKWQKLVKEHAELESIVSVYKLYSKVIDDKVGAEELLELEDDEEMILLVEQELKDLEVQKAELEDKLKKLLIPKDPNDEKNVIMEIRAGTGGEEAALFAGDLFRMYSRYAERKGWKTEYLSANPTDIGGFREVIFVIEGKGAFSKLKFESGVHRVQRIPSTESGGRIHTSAATVAVLPEAEEVELKLILMILELILIVHQGQEGKVLILQILQ